MGEVTLGRGEGEAVTLRGAEVQGNPPCSIKHWGPSYTTPQGRAAWAEACPFIKGVRD